MIYKLKMNLILNLGGGFFSIQQRFENHISTFQKTSLKLSLEQCALDITPL